MTPHYCAQVELKPVWPTQPDLGVLARKMQFTAKAAVWREIQLEKTVSETHDSSSLKHLKRNFIKPREKGTVHTGKQML